MGVKKKDYLKLINMRSQNYLCILLFRERFWCLKNSLFHTVLSATVKCIRNFKFNIKCANLSNFKRMKNLD